MEMAGQLGPGFRGIGFVAEQQPVDLGFLDDPAAAMIGEARIVIAGDPGPAGRRGQGGQQFPGLCRQPVAAVTVVEAVAQAPDLGGAGRGDERG